MNPNPFKPTAGKRPPILIGRESVIEDFEEGLDNGAGAPGRLMLITGNRGCGKTVLLRELQRLANERGWAVVSESASLGLCEARAYCLRLTRHNLRLSRNWRLLPFSISRCSEIRMPRACPITTSAVLRWCSPAYPVWLTTCSKSRA